MAAKLTFLPTHFVRTQEYRLNRTPVLERRLRWRLALIRANGWVICGILIYLVYIISQVNIVGYYLTTAGGKINQIHPIENPVGDD